MTLMATDARISDPLAAPAEWCATTGAAAGGCQSGALISGGLASEGRQSGGPAPVELAREGAAPVSADFEVPFTDDFLAVRGRAMADRRILLRRTGPANAPAVLVLGGISAGRAAAAHGDARGWWPEIVRPGGPVDTAACAVWTAEYFPLQPTGALDLAPADYARQFVKALKSLGVERLDAIIGASFGGMVALEIARLYPSFVGRLAVLCAAGKPSPMGRAWRRTQRRVLQLGIDAGREEDAVAIARELGVTTYRTAAEFNQRFQSSSELESYLLAQGERFAGRVSARRYLALSAAIDAHDLPAGAVRAPTHLIAVEEDQLVPVADVEALAAGIDAPTRLDVISSVYGHDGFLKETDKVGAILRRALNEEMSQ